MVGNQQRFPAREGTRLKVRLSPAGVHLFDRKTGQNLLVDEVRVPAAMWASAPRHVSVALTNACDLHCVFCYAPKHLARLERSRVSSWLVELDQNGCIGVGFGGGEPTLHPEFGFLCEYAALRTQLSVTFTTHAHRLDDGLLEQLRGCVHFVRVSMDGVHATYESIRGRSFVSFERRLTAIRKVVPFGVNYVVNSRTLSDLDRAIRIASEAGASEFLLLPEQPVRGLGGIDSSTAAGLRHWIANYQGPIPLSISEAGADGLPTCDPLAAERGLRAYAHIDASGVLKRSSFDEWGISVGPQGVMAALATLDDAGETR